MTFTAGTDFFSGDLLFAGSIGRTDMPGGSYAEILDSLARIPMRLPDEIVVRPGHGPDTTIGRERAMNPFLQELAEACPPSPGGCDRVGQDRPDVGVS